MAWIFIKSEEQRIKICSEEFYDIVLGLVYYLINGENFNDTYFCMKVNPFLSSLHKTLFDL